MFLISIEQRYEDCRNTIAVVTEGDRNLAIATFRPGFQHRLACTALLNTASCESCLILLTLLNKNSTRFPAG